MEKQTNLKLSTLQLTAGLLNNQERSFFWACLPAFVFGVVRPQQLTNEYFLQNEEGVIVLYQEGYLHFFQVPVCLHR